MARRVEEIKRVRRDLNDENTSMDGRYTTPEDRANRDAIDNYEEEYYEVGDATEETGLNAASGVLALALLALAVYLIWAALQ